MSSPELKRESRRNFLKTTAQHSAVFILGSGFCLACSGEQALETSIPVSLGKAADFPLGLTTLAVFRVVVIKKQQLNDFVFKVMSLVCTHQTCLLNTAGDAGFRCPCHGSEFDLSGQVLRGPAKRDLPYFKLELSPEGDLLLHHGTRVATDVALILPKQSPR